ncbi:MAG: hypothetical protein AAF687_09405 [Pseudomonadota bacterium]
MPFPVAVCHALDLFAAMPTFTNIGSPVPFNVSANRLVTANQAEKRE